MSRPHNVALFIDGTWNNASGTEPTNVYKLFRACHADLSGDDPQVTYYLPGVGHDIRQRRIGAGAGWYGGPWTDSASRPEEPPRALGARWALGGLFGVGTTARVKEAYTFLCQHFVRDRGDRIYVFGFSRGAFAARSLAGFVFRVGTLLADKLHLVEAAYAVYESGLDPNDTLLSNFLQGVADLKMLQHSDGPSSMPLHFVGLWDTVAALNLPERIPLFTADRTEHHQGTPPLNVLAARHALALHELRASYKPEVWAASGHRNLEQVWFTGAHADVGGGYPLTEGGLSNVALQWMADEASAHALSVRDTVLDEYLSTGDATLHNSLSGKFRLFSPTPRDALLTMHEQKANGTPGDILYFHRSVSRYLDGYGRSIEVDWPKKASDVKASVDKEVLQLYALNRLRGHEPKGRADYSPPLSRDHDR